jgi:HupE/UreJ protein
MTLRWWLALMALPAWAHVVSMSSGDLTIDGARGHYELRMPLYEVTHVAKPETALLEHVRFSGARLISSNCRAESGRDAYICDAEYDFGSPPDRVDAECTLASITVPNHVHLLRVTMGGKRDQAMFDLNFTRATLRFRPPSAAEVAATEMAGGFARALGGPAQILFLAALALAARGRRELARLVAMFLIGQAAAVLIVPHTSWQPAPRFVEAAAALTIAYMAVEILMLPEAGARWLIAGVLGVFHGLFFYLFVQAAGYRPGFVLAGAAVAEIAVVAALALIFAKVVRWGAAIRPVQVSASALLVFGMVWFILRLRG